MQVVYGGYTKSGRIISGSHMICCNLILMQTCSTPGTYSHTEMVEILRFASGRAYAKPPAQQEKSFILCLAPGQVPQRYDNYTPATDRGKPVCPNGSRTERRAGNCLPTPSPYLGISENTACTYTFGSRTPSVDNSAQAPTLSP